MSHPLFYNQETHTEIEARARAEYLYKHYLLVRVFGARVNGPNGMRAVKHGMLGLVYDTLTCRWKDIVLYLVTAFVAWKTIELFMHFM